MSNKMDNTVLTKDDQQVERTPSFAIANMNIIIIVLATLNALLGALFFLFSDMVGMVGILFAVLSLAALYLMRSMKKPLTEKVLFWATVATLAVLIAILLFQLCYYFATYII